MRPTSLDRIFRLCQEKRFASYWMFFALYLALQVVAQENGPKGAPLAQGPLGAQQVKGRRKAVAENVGVTPRPYEAFQVGVGMPFKGFGKFSQQGTDPVQGILAEPPYVSNPGIGRIIRGIAESRHVDWALCPDLPKHQVC